MSGSNRPHQSKGTCYTSRLQCTARAVFHLLQHDAQVRLSTAKTWARLPCLAKGIPKCCRDQKVSCLNMLNGTYHFRWNTSQNVMINCRKRKKKEMHSLFQLQLLSQLWSRLYMTTPSLTSCQLTHAKAMWGNWHQSGLSFLMPKP